MVAKLITVANQKGGSGKTTVSMQIAGTLGMRAYRVLVIDADPQATAQRWAASADEDSPFPAAVAGLSAAGGKVHQEARKYIDQYDVIVIDCPPAVDSPVPQSALMISDLALVPIIPSPADLWATKGTQRLIENAQDFNEALQARLMLNMLQSQTSLGREAETLLIDFGTPRMDAHLGLRQAYRQAQLYGATVHALERQSKAINEVNALTDEVMAILGESNG